MSEHTHKFEWRGVQPGTLEVHLWFACECGYTPNVGEILTMLNEHAQLEAQVRKLTIERDLWKNRLLKWAKGVRQDALVMRENERLRLQASDEH